MTSKPNKKINKPNCKQCNYCTRTKCLIDYYKGYIQNLKLYKEITDLLYYLLNMNTYLL